MEKNQHCWYLVFVNLFSVTRAFWLTSSINHIKHKKANI